MRTAARTAADVLNEMIEVNKAISGSDRVDLSPEEEESGKANLFRQALLGAELAGCLSVACSRHAHAITHRGQVHFCQDAAVPRAAVIHRLSTIPAASVPSPFKPVALADLLPTKTRSKAKPAKADPGQPRAKRTAKAAPSPETSPPAP